MFDGSFAWFEGARFPAGVEGVDHWRIAAAMDFDPVVTEEELRKLRTRRRKPLVHARLFIPHRRADLEVAKRLAFLANKHGLDYWLEVDDPALAGMVGGLVQGAAHALAVAMAIELAILNCSHLCTVVTSRSLDRTAGGEPQQAGPSLWTAYAYGRMRDDALASQSAACWVSPAAAALPLPEYTLLGSRYANEMEFESWLQAASGAARQRPLAHDWLRATKPLHTLG